MKRSRRVIQTELKNNMKEYNRLKAIEEQAKKQLAEVKDIILTDMDELGISKEEDDMYGTFSITESYIREGVDAKALKKRFEPIYKMVKTTTVVSRSLRVNQPKKKK